MSDRGGPSVANSSSLLFTMAILLAHYDSNRDYLSIFEPFVIDSLKHWPAGKEARPKQICEALAETYHLPHFPINTVTELRDRMRRRDFLVQNHSNQHFPNPETLAKVPSLRAGRSAFLDHLDYLVESIRVYAATAHDLDWSHEEAEEALESFVEEFSIELAMAKRDGGMEGDPTLSRNEALAVVHGFARRALEEDDRGIDYLEEFVQASMLANVIYLQDLASWKPSLDRLVVFLDTTVVLRVLGLTDEEVSEAAREMVGLLGEFDVPVQVFDHNLVEIIGVLRDVQRNLLEDNRGRTNLERLAHRGQEVLAHALRCGWGAADVELVIGELRDRLAQQGIAVAPTPKTDPRLPLDHPRLAEILEQYGFTHYQRTVDAHSLTAIHVLREGRTCTELGQARAIFVTSNDNLVRASRMWFEEQGKGSLVPQCTTEMSLTTQLWLRRPEGRPNVARKFLVAEANAALNPSPELWNRYLDRIEQRRLRKEITEDQVKTLVFSTEAREILVEVAHGEPGLVDDRTVSEVLARSENRIPPAFTRELETTQASVDALRKQNAAMQEEIAARDQSLKSQAGEMASQSRNLAYMQEKIDELTASDQRRSRQEKIATRQRRLRREVRGTIAAAGFVVAAVLLWFLAGIDSGFVRAAIGFTGICLAVGSLAFGFRKNVRWAGKVIVLIGALPAAFFGLINLADRGQDDSSPPPVERPQSRQP
jgi:hypothetical protein